ncbi:MAG: UDP-3-O-(3-hydroxymyristoyl)glucosamine N-acyltransferase [Desulfobacterales bacterium]|nr:UDP-3-O-(3-hydroxymyristoyl)glucosamine N-acyltransferase [Desulfobacterales bacterium]
MKKYTVNEINRHVNGILTGDPAVPITGVEQIDRAEKNQLTFIGEKKYIKLWSQSNGSAAIVQDGFDLEPGENKALIRVGHVDLALARVLELFEPDLPACAPGIHPAAVVDATADIGNKASIGAGCFIGPGVRIGDRARLYPNVTVYDHCRIGNDTTIWSGTVIRERCRIGDRCILHPNVTVGADGFGYRPAPDGNSLVKIPHIGTVMIGDDVEIGAGTCIDRGKFSATAIGNGTKIDNLVQIGHNCRIGRSCVISGMVGIAGSATLGDGVMIGGATTIKDHVVIGNGAKLGGNSGVISDVAPGQTVMGFPADEYGQTLRQWAALKQLPALLKHIRKR